jgi:hypothetical protein
MTQTITINDPALFCAANLCTGKEQTRPYLHGVYVQPATGGGILLTATDGHILFHGHDPHGTAERAAIIVPDKGKLPAPWAKGGTITIDLAQGIMRHTTGGLTAGCREDGGTFPFYPNVIPREFSGEVSQFNPALVARFGDIAQILTKGSFPGIQHNGNGPALVTFARRDCFGVVMPIRANAVPDLSRPTLPTAA